MPVVIIWEVYIVINLQRSADRKRSQKTDAFDAKRDATGQRFVDCIQFKMLSETLDQFHQKFLELQDRITS